MKLTEGYPLRKITFMEQLLMWLASPVLFPIIPSVLIGVVFGVMNAGQTSEELLEGIGSLDGLITFVGFAGSLLLMALIITQKKLPVMNRKRLTREESVGMRGLTKEDWKFLGWFVPVSYVLFNIGGTILEIVMGGGELVNQEAVEALVVDTPLWMLFIIIVIAAPIAEEWLFRGVIFFRGEHNEISWTTLIVTSILFGLVHVPTTVVAVYTYVGMGLLFGYAAKRTRSVEAAIFFHFVNNLIGFIVLAAAG
ncbi:Membrane-bound protease, CAAX family [Alkalibacterium sp. AK22]|uniref:CPBP family intramembrane glutamic endopeptidase n=1 Tax=Alkalibacterium sp. AK22 TaxID=1229520 RepID=UPI00044EF5BC|nr:type II CAAX endopeptidase family protein [Alkalibacterium sp. AK22]EXJ22682.1 Membrane-bound protease, CAAX family [Alkalibacterium sp. AK22]